MTDLTAEQLEAELTRRKRETQAAPKPLAVMDFSVLSSIVIAIIEEAASEKYLDDDSKTHVWEAAVTAVYGKDFWTWRRKQEW